MIYWLVEWKQNAIKIPPTIFSDKLRSPKRDLSQIFAATIWRKTRFRYQSHAKLRSFCPLFLYFHIFSLSYKPRGWKPECRKLLLPPRTPWFSFQAGENLKERGVFSSTRGNVWFGGEFSLNFALTAPHHPPRFGGSGGETALGGFSRGCNETVGGLSNVNLIF